MRRFSFLVLIFMAMNLAAWCPAPARGQGRGAKSTAIASAKTVFFDDQSGDAVVGGAALAELKKWGRFQIVTEQGQADLILLLSVDPFHGGNVIMADGKVGTTDTNGDVEPDVETDATKKKPSERDAYLTAIVPKTNEVVWSDSHVWGGVLTGSNSAGERLMKKFEGGVGK